MPLLATFARTLVVLMMEAWGRMSEDVGSEGALDIGAGDIGEILVDGLRRGIVDQDVDAAKGPDRLFNECLASGRITDIARQQQPAPSRFLHPAPRLLGIALLIRQIGDGHVRTFTRISNGDGAADPAVAAGDERRHPGQQAFADITFLAVVRLGVHVCFQARRRLLRLVREAGRFAGSGILGHGAGTRDHSKRFTHEGAYQEFSAKLCQEQAVSWRR